MINDKWYSLTELRSKLKPSNSKNIIGSLNVTTKTGIPVKLVFVKNRNKHKKNGLFF